jgi:hypothetical protein
VADRKITVDIIADPSKFKSGVGEVEKSGGKLNSIFQGIGQGVGQKVFSIFDGAIDKGMEFIGSSTEAASNLNETVSKIGVVFGKNGDDMLKWAQNSATAMGMSKNAALGAAGTYGNLFVSMGMGTEKAADMSKGIVGLAGDLASFNNLSPEEVLEKLRSGLTGETEPLKSLGININEATLKAKAMEMGLWDGKGALDAGAKAQASYAIMLEQTTTAQGDFARTADGLANKQRIASAKMEDAQARLGNIFMKVASVALPIFSDALTSVMDVVSGATEALSPLVDQYGPAIGKVFTDAGNAVSGFVSIFTGGSAGVGEQATGLNETIGKIGSTFSGVFADIRLIVQGAIGFISDIWHTFGDDILGYAKAAIQGVKENFQGALEVIQGVFDVFGGIFSGDWGRVWNGIRGIFTGIKDMLVADVKFLFTGLIPAAISAGSKIIGGAVDLVIVQPITAAFNGIVDFVSKLPGRIGGAAVGMWDGIWNAFRGTINSLIKGWNGMKFTLPAVDVPFFGRVGGFSLGTPDLPYLHQGGVVPGVPGSDVLAVLQAGERVTRVGASGGTVVNINIMEGAYIDGPSVDRLANLITQRLRYAPGL